MIHGANLSPTELLWRAVLAQSIRDISSTVKRERNEVIEWLKTRDFLVVCEYSAVEPDMMLEQMTSLVQMPRELARKYGDLLREQVMRGVYHN